MPRYHIRAFLPSGDSAIVKPNAENVFDALAQAAREIKESGTLLSAFDKVRVRTLGQKTSGVYMSKARKKTGRGFQGKPKAVPAAATTTPAVVAAPAETPAPAKANKPKPAA